MKKTYLTLFLMAAVSAASAQQKATQASIFDLPKSSYSELEDLIYQTINQRFNEPSVPRYILFDRDNQYALGVGGTVRLTSSFGFGKIIPGTPNYSFIPAQIPVGGDALTRSQYLMSANTSQFFIKLVGRNAVLKDFTAFLSMNFTGGSTGRAPQLRQGYLSFRGFLAGQAWSTFSDLNAVSPTIDFQGPNGANELLNYQIRYTLPLRRHWSFALSAEMPIVNARYPETVQSIDQSIPDFVGYGQYAWNGGTNHVRLSALMRNMNYHDNLTDNNHLKTGWAVQLSGVANITPDWVVYFQGTGGKGFGSYMNDFSMLNLDLVERTTDPGRMQMLPMWCGFVGVQYNFSPRVFVSGTYSHCKIYARESYPAPDGYKIGQYIVGNIFWNLTSNCQLGAEYLYGRRINTDTSARSANRVNIMVQYNF